MAFNDTMSPVLIAHAVKASVLHGEGLHGLLHGAAGLRTGGREAPPADYVPRRQTLSPYEEAQVRRCLLEWGIDPAGHTG